MSRRHTANALAAAESRRLLRERTGRAHVLLTGRGATAIWATLRALDLHDRPVLIPANTCYIVLWAVLQSGNLPFLADIDPLTGNISAQTLDQSGVHPAVLIPAHMYGIPAPMAEIMAWARERRAFVIEDAALSAPTTASSGNVSIFSFGQEKIVDAGGGGALVTDDAHLASEIERILADAPLWSAHLEQLNHQWLQLYWPLHQFESDNARLAELYPILFDIYGAITRARLRDGSALRSALSTLDANLAHRRELADLYDQAFAHAPIRLLPRPPGTALWRYPMIVPRDRRNDLLERLWSEQLFGVTRWYPSLQTMRHALAPHLPITPTPAADQFAQEIINLPLSPETDHAEAARTTALLLDAL